MFTGMLAHTATRIYWPVIPDVTGTRTTCLVGAQTVSLPANATLMAHGSACGKQSWLAKRQVMEFTEKKIQSRFVINIIFTL